MFVKFFLKNKKFKTLNIFALTIIAAFLFCSQVSAIGQVTDPIIIKDALRGEKIQETLFIVNTDDKEAKIDLISEGDIKDWVKFYNKNDVKTPIQSVVIPANSRLDVIAYFNIPKNISNGEYRGLVSVIKKPDVEKKKEETSASILQKIDREVTIIISDKENIKLEASIIPNEFDLKKDEPLSIRIIFDNQGNVSINPQVQLKIKKGNKTVYNAIFPYPEDMDFVKPLEQVEIPAIEIPISSFEKGQYLAEINILYNNKIILEKDFQFSVDIIGHPIKKNNIINLITFNFKTINWPKISIFIVVILVLIILIFICLNIKMKIKKNKKNQLHQLENSEKSKEKNNKKNNK